MEFIRKIESLATYYRGRISFLELMNMPLSYISTLYKIAEEREKAEQARKKAEEAQGKTPGISQREAEALEDELEGMM